MLVKNESKKRKVVRWRIPQSIAIEGAKPIRQSVLILDWPPLFADIRKFQKTGLIVSFLTYIEDLL